MAEKIVQTAGRTKLGKFAPEFAHYNDDILLVRTGIMKILTLRQGVSLR